MKRLFIAIDLPFEIKKKIDECKKTLEVNIKHGVKWVELENYHFTIKFLGETQEEKIESISKIIEEISSEFKPFYISFKELGVFPNFKNPRVIWIGIDEGLDEMQNIFNTLEKRITKLGFPKDEKEFSPHLTLGRVKERLKWKEDWKIDIPEIRFLAIELTLFESQLSSQGPTYIPLYRSKFKKNG
ncbi:MAG: RNA 2',3'-cyclic phosphodiesterase [Dictyoglomus sp. NZ13-RE01]|nr:MAG: RNA 2',3'-cyclic phosphodiesterase [Dictyoglomus sp. NZ13-RE01]